MVDVLAAIETKLNEEPNRDGGYDLSSEFVQDIYRELDQHVHAGLTIRRREPASLHRYIRDRSGKAGSWWRSPYDLREIATEIKNLRSGGHPYPPQDRIEQALNLIMSYGQIDGDHQSVGDRPSRACSCGTRCL